MTATRERPILFSGPMVRAILDGRKTQTRRAVKNADWYACLSGDCPHDTQSECDAGMRMSCPYGQPGDRLWVREQHKRSSQLTASGISRAVEYADGALQRCTYSHVAAWNPWRWRPSIHMPRWASRITLEVTGVRVERLQEISEEDAKAEGVERLIERYVVPGSVPVQYQEASHVDFFRYLWDQINPKHPWDSNPWVWVIEFRRIQEKAPTSD